MKAWTLVVLASSACTGAAITPSATCPDAGLSGHPRAAAYSSVLTELCAAARSPGCVVVVDRPGEPLWAGSVGLSNLSTGAPMCVETPMRIGSVSKTYVAALVLKLVDEGKLSLGTTLAQALPEVVGRVPSADRITLEQLLSHRSGVLNPETQDLLAQTDYFDRPDDLLPLTLPQRLERYLYDRPLLFPPGTAQRYSNPGYDLLGLVVERAEGTSLQAALQRVVLSPLGQTRTSFDDRDAPDIARGYVYTAEGLLLDITEGDKANVSLLSPSGGLVSTGREVASFFRALFDQRIVSAEALATMQRGEGTLRQGLMARTTSSGKLGYGHQGSLFGESTWALYFPESQTVVVTLVNSDGTADEVQFIDRLVP